MDIVHMPVLSVKLKIPKPRESYIVRDGLYKKLDQASNYKLTVIKAGAGSGKTTLLSAFIKDRKKKEIKWITVDETMNQVFVFWNYVFEANADLFQENAKSFQNTFDGNGQKELLWQLIAVLANKMEDAGERFLIFDDFWHITDEFLIQTLDYFIGCLPESVHIVLITRTMPAIYLGTLTLENQVLFIDDEEMQFSKEESMAFLEKTLHESYNDAEKETMIRECNGWIGGLQLMAIASGNQRDKHFLPSNAKKQVIFEYISKEIYSYLGKEEKEFLKMTSVLPYFNQEICRRFLPEYNFEEMVGRIISHNLFVIQMEEQTKDYRYHSIMKDFLMSLYIGEDEEKRRICEKAATIFYIIGAYEESMEELFLVHSYERAMEYLLKMPQNVVTYSYMMRIPKEEIVKNADFAYQYFFCFYASLDIKKCEEIYGLIMNQIKDEKTLRAFANADCFFVFGWKFDEVRTVSLDVIEKMPLTDVSKAYFLIKEAYFLFVEDKTEEAFQYLERAEQIYQKTGNEYIGLFVLTERTQILEKIGEFRKSLLEYEKFYKLLELAPAMKCAYYIGIAGMHINQLELKKADEELKLAKKYMRKGVRDMYGAYLYTAAQYYMLIGRAEDAEQIYSKLSENEAYKSIYFKADLLNNSLYLARHPKEEKEFLESYRKEDVTLRIMEVEITYIRLNKEASQQEQINHLDQLIMRARKSQNKRIIVEAGLIKIRYMIGKKKEERNLVNLMIEVFSYAGEERMGLVLWNEKEGITKIFEQYKEKLRDALSKQSYNYAASILDQKEARKDEILTEREIDVLTEMEKGYTNKQIAEELCISLATVKTHLINIYSKLGVSNRIEAITKWKNRHDSDTLSL